MTKTVYINGKFLSQRVTGVQRFAIEVITAFDDLKTDIKFIVLYPINAKPLCGLKNVEFVQIGKKVGYWWEQMTLPSYLRKQNACYFLNLCNLAPVLFPGTIVIHDVNMLDNKEFFSFAYRNVVKLITGLNIKRYKTIFTQSNFSKERIIYHYNIQKEKIKVINSGVVYMKQKDKNYQENFPFSNHEFYLTVGSKNPTKNFKFIIECAKRHPELTFVITGNLDKVYSEELLEEVNNAIFMGYLLDDELAYLYNKTKAFIFPSFYEGFGLPPLEALACGCKNLVLSDIPVLKEIYGEVAFYVDPNNPLTFDEFLNNPLKITQSEVDVLLERYTWEKTANKIIANMNVGD